MAERAPLRRGFFFAACSEQPDFLVHYKIRRSTVIRIRSRKCFSNPFQILLGCGDVLLQLIEPILQKKAATSAALQLIANAARLVLEFRQRIRQGARLILESLNVD